VALLFASRKSDRHGAHGMVPSIHGTGDEFSPEDTLTHTSLSGVGDRCAGGNLGLQVIMIIINIYHAIDQDGVTEM